MPQVMFEDLGPVHRRPVNGHDIAAVETALRRGRSLDEPVPVHMITERAVAGHAGRGSARPLPRGRPDSPRDRAPGP